MELPPDLLVDRRPPTVLRRIEKKFATAVVKDNSTAYRKRWLRKGHLDDYVFGSVEASELANLMCVAGDTETTVDTMSILDIGAGRAVTLSNIAARVGVRNAVAMGATLPAEVPANVSYVTGCLENRAMYEGLDDRPDLVVSRYTFMHFADPIGTLELVANSLKNKGIMAISQLPANIIMPEYEYPKMLEAAGLRVFHFKPERLETTIHLEVMCQRVTEEPIHFPLDYKQSRFSVGILEPQTLAA